MQRGRTINWQSCGVAVLWCLAVGTRLGVAAEQQVRPQPAELVGQIIRDEDAFDRAKSLYLKFEGKWTRTPESIAKETARLKKQFPQAEITPQRFTALRETLTEELVLAFDRRRVFRLWDQHDASRDVRFFDDARAVAHAKYHTHEQEHYSLDATPYAFFGNYFVDLAWLRMGVHNIWFSKDDFTPEDRQRINGRPADYQLVGAAEYGGRNCWVLENPLARRRLHVGKEDGRLYGLTILFVPRDIELLPLVNRASGRQFAKLAEAEVWSKKLAPDELERYVNRLNEEMFPFAKTLTEFALDDYRELAPGFWFPAQQSYTMFDTQDPQNPVSGNRELRLAESKVDQPLDDSLFAIEFRDGVQVNDFGHDPPLSYKYQQDRTPAEMQEIIDQAREQNDAWKNENAARDAFVGQPAPELTPAARLHGAPASLAALKGRIVILDFWSVWCGPCRNDLPKAEEIHKQATESGISIIGVHAAGAATEDVEELCQQLELTYPMIIDQPAPPGKQAFGKLSAELNVRGIPYAFVIDAAGNIAGHGSFGEVMAKARALVQGQQ